MKPLMPGDPEKSEQGKITPFIFCREGEFFSCGDGDAENDHAHPKAQPNDCDGGNFLHAELGSNERCAPDNDGEENFEIEDNLFFLHFLSKYIF